LLRSISDMILKEGLGME